MQISENAILLHRPFPLINYILKVTTEHTNNKIKVMYFDTIENEKDLKTYFNHINKIELKAYYAILYYSDLWKSSNINYVC